MTGPRLDSTRRADAENVTPSVRAGFGDSAVVCDLCGATLDPADMTLTGYHAVLMEARLAGLALDELPEAMRRLARCQGAAA